MHHVLYIDPLIYPFIDFVTYELADDELFKLETAQEVSNKNYDTYPPRN